MRWATREFNPVVDMKNGTVRFYKGLNSVAPVSMLICARRIYMPCGKLWLSSLPGVSKLPSSKSGARNTVVQSLWPKFSGLPEKEIPFVLFQHAREHKTGDLEPYFMSWSLLIKSNTTFWNARQVSMAFYGLKQINLVASPDALHLALALSEKAHHCRGDFGFGMSQMFMGLSSTKHADLKDPDSFKPTFESAKQSDLSKILNVFISKLQLVCAGPSGLNGQSIGSICYSIRHLSTHDPTVRTLVKTLARAIRSSNQTTPLNSMATANSLFGLQSMHSSYAEVRDLCAALAEKLDSSLSASDFLSEQGISNAIYGLQGLSSDHAEVRALVRALIRKLSDRCSEKGYGQMKLTPQFVGNSLVGLQNMSSEYPEVRSLISVLISIIEESSTFDSLQLNGQHMGCALVGLKSLSSEHMEVRKLVALLTQLVQRSRFMFDKGTVSAIIGIQNMSLEHEEVVALLGTITTKLAQLPDDAKISNGWISSALSGLRNMDCGHPSAEALLLQLNRFLLNNPKAIFHGHCIAAALHVLQHMNPHQECVRQLLVGLTTALRTQNSRVQGNLTAAEIAQAMIGLKNMSSEVSEVRELLVPLVEMIFRSCSIHGIRLNAEEYAHLVHGLQHLSSDHFEVRALVNVLAIILEANKDVMLSSRNIINICVGLTRLHPVDGDEVKELLRVLAKQIKGVISSNKALQFTEDEVSQAVRGLCKSLSDCNEHAWVLAESILSPAKAVLAQVVT